MIAKPTTPKNSLCVGPTLDAPCELTSRESKSSHRSTAAQALVQSGLIFSQRSATGFAEGDRSFDTVREPEDLLKLRFTIPLSMHLVERLSAMSVLPGSSKVQLGAAKSPFIYALSCDKDLEIWSDCADTVLLLRDFPLTNPNKRSEVTYFLLWAMNTVLPNAYKKLIEGTFGTAKDVTPPQTRPLPEPIPYDAQEPALEFHDGKVMGYSELHPCDLVHVLTSGTTGVGKTYGVVKPLLMSFLRYRNAMAKAMGLLVIDPKAELLRVCVDELAKLGQSKRLIRLGSGKRLRFFMASCVLSVEDRYRELSDMVRIKSTGETAIWAEKGHRLNIDMAELDRMFQLQTGFLLWGVVRSLIEGVDHTRSPQWDNIAVVYRHALASKSNLEWLAAISTVLIRLCPELTRVNSVFATYLGDPEMQNQLYYRVSNAEAICKGLGAPEVCTVINTELFPAADGDDASVEELLDAGHVIVLQPTATHFGDIAGRLVKSRFFADSLTRRDMRQPIGYVADEFQKFVTGDRETGEQSFLDRCRAYRVTCVLATQSLAALELALHESGASAPRLAVDILVANTPTKVIYRSLDASTRDALMNWIPPAPLGQAHVVDIRPPAQLPTATAYYLCNGKWGFYRYTKEQSTSLVALCDAALA